MTVQEYIEHLKLAIEASKSDVERTNGASDYEHGMAIGRMITLANLLELAETIKEASHEG